jgi:hypothetical protein
VLVLKIHQQPSINPQTTKDSESNNNKDSYTIRESTEAQSAPALSESTQNRTGLKKKRRSANCNGIREGERIGTESVHLSFVTEKEALDSEEWKLCRN